MKKIIEFIDRTLNKWRYPSAQDYTMRERIFAWSLKISEEVGELHEQILGKFWWQRNTKTDKISDEKLKNEIADIILSAIRLWRLMDLDIQELLDNKIKTLEIRFSENNKE